MAEIDIAADKVARVIFLAREIEEQTAVGAHDGVRDGAAGRVAEHEFPFIEIALDFALRADDVHRAGWSGGAAGQYMRAR